MNAIEQWIKDNQTFNAQELDHGPVIAASKVLEFLQSMQGADTKTPTNLCQESVELPEIYDQYQTWPEDIRRKLSLHDLRRMTGWKLHCCDPQSPSVAEVTPEMQAAGMTAWDKAHKSGTREWPEMLETVFLAMLTASGKGE